MYTLEAMPDSEEPVEVFFVIEGGLILYDDDGNYFGYTDAQMALDMYYGALDAAGIPRPHRDHRIVEFDDIGEILWFRVDQALCLLRLARSMAGVRVRRGSGACAVLSLPEGGPCRCPLTRPAPR